MPRPPSGTAELSQRQRTVSLNLSVYLANLCVLNLFGEYWTALKVDSFTISMLVAAVLQGSLALAIGLKRRVFRFFTAFPGKPAKLFRLLGVWAVSFGSKYAILWGVDRIFGDHVEIRSVWVIFAILITLMVVEVLALRLFWSPVMTGRRDASG